MESTRNKLINLLSKNNDQYISGQMLSDELNISRSAVWKHINELKKDGYVIEGKSNKGYRIIKFPDKMSENTIKWGLKTKWLGKNIKHFDTVTSTQTVAHEEAQNNAINGTVIVADEQTKGRGRITRNWQSTSGKGVWLSMILRPEIPPQEAPKLTLLTATVLADVLRNYVHVEPQIKWPNDILINGKKTAGILTEMQAEQDRIWYVIVGFGLNVNHTIEELPENINYKATSLRVETDTEWKLNDLIQEILVTFEKTYDYYLEHGFADIKEKWESYGFKMGKEISIKTMKSHWKAPFLGITNDGALITKDMDGNRTTLYSAEIDWFKD